MTDGITADTAIGIIILGALLPPLLNLVYKARLESNVKALATLGVAAVLGTINAWFMGDLTRDSVLVSVAGVWLIASGSHEFFWKPVGATSSKNGDAHG